MKKVLIVALLAGAVAPGLAADSRVQQKYWWVEVADDTYQGFSDLNKFFRSLDKTSGGRLLNPKSGSR